MYLPTVGRQHKGKSQPLHTSAAPSSKLTWLMRWKAAGFTVLLFALFAEWFYPLQEVGGNIDLSDVRPFLVAVAIYLLLGLIVHHTALSVVLYGMVAIGTTAWMFGSVRVLPHASDTWLMGEGFVRSLLAGIGRIGTALRTDINGWMDGHWLNTSGELRTLLLLIGWAMLASSIQSLMLSRRTVLFFTVSTIVYLFGFELGFGLDITGSIARSVGWGLLLSAWLYLDEQLESDTERSRIGHWPFSWLLCALLLSLAVVGIAEGIRQVYAWPKPMPLASFEALTQSLQPNDLAERGRGRKDGNNGSAVEGQDQVRTSMMVTGYSTDDSELGRPLRDNNEEWFTAISPEPTYWRGESKSIYTGRGWTSPQKGEEKIELSSSLKLDQTGGHEGWSEPFQQTIIWKGFKPKYPLLFGGVPERITSWVPNANAEEAGNEVPSQYFVRYNPLSERYGADIGISDTTGAPLTYQYETRVFRFQTELLQSAPEKTWPDDIRAAGLQLPEALPNRVRELGKRITAGADSQYDKVRRVQQFLQQEYMYTKSDTTVPPAGRDFVDYFLFDSRQGYCNHFSTSMAVLLRTQGIPARWVKGFALGEADSPGHYTIRGTDAHSWVEVYFASIGWVPFEATPPIGVPGGSVAASNPDVITASTPISEGTGGLSTAASEQAGYRTPPEVVAMLNDAAAEKTGEGWVAVRQFGNKIAQWWDARVQATRAHIEQEWHALQRVPEEWTSEASRSGIGTALLSLVRKAVTQMPVLLFGGVIFIVFLLLTMKWAWQRNAMQRKLRRLVHAQQHSFRMSRVQEMGRIAWSLVERKYGAKPCGMTWNEYAGQAARTRIPSASNPTRHTEHQDLERDKEPLDQFITACNLLFFGGQQGNAAVQQQFVDGCARVLRDCNRDKR
ncbi:transglutaminase-like domain-containing protein [Paenibacillus alvei]|uniref:Transglutaminase-like domain-containing protein n=1 Tax=Paenibacillus alvei TaxID=44250 RepID=A0ABT4E299_PAEAL|nr:transglutaminase-like domain-containing protein [Paenibacillus alvei]MCY9527852.1 transglutaminase-like domain-containing protein [Paenibacillus alvei]